MRTHTVASTAAAGAVTAAWRKQGGTATTDPDLRFASNSSPTPAPGRANYVRALVSAQTETVGTLGEMLVAQEERGSRVWFCNAVRVVGSRLMWRVAAAGVEATAALTME